MSALPSKNFATIAALCAGVCVVGASALASPPRVGGRPREPAAPAAPASVLEFKLGVKLVLSPLPVTPDAAPTESEVWNPRHGFRMPPGCVTASPTVYLDRLRLLRDERRKGALQYDALTADGLRMVTDSSLVSLDGVELLVTVVSPVADCPPPTIVFATPQSRTRGQTLHRTDYSGSVRFGGDGLQYVKATTLLQVGTPELFIEVGPRGSATTVRVELRTGEWRLGEAVHHAGKVLTPSSAPEPLKAHVGLRLPGVEALVKTQSGACARFFDLVIDDAYLVRGVPEAETSGRDGLSIDLHFLKRAAPVSRDLGCVNGARWPEGVLVLDEVGSPSPTMSSSWGGDPGQPLRAFVDSGTTLVRLAFGGPLEPTALVELNFATGTASLVRDAPAVTHEAVDDLSAEWERRGEDQDVYALRAAHRRLLPRVALPLSRAELVKAVCPRVAAARPRFGFEADWALARGPCTR